MSMNMCIRIIIFALAAVAMIPAAVAQSTTRTFEDSMGRDVGRADTQGNVTTFRDSMGRETGRAVRSGSGTTFYDSSGRQTGRSSRR
jgi:hypothetical protein